MSDTNTDTPYTSCDCGELLGASQKTCPECGADNAYTGEPNNKRAGVIRKSVEAVEAVIKRVADRRADARKARDERLATMRGELDGMVADLRKAHPKLTEQQVLSSFGTVRALSSDIAALEAAPLDVPHPAEEIAKSALAEIDREIATAERRRTEAHGEYQRAHNLSASAAKTQLLKQRLEDRNRGNVHWADQLDQDIEKLAERRRDVVAEAQKRVEAVLMAPVIAKRAESEAAAAKRAELEAQANEPHPIHVAYESYITTYAKTHGVAREQALLRLLTAKDETFLALRAAAQDAPSKSVGAAAARKCLDAMDALEVLEKPGNAPMTGGDAANIYARAVDADIARGGDGRGAVVPDGVREAMYRAGYGRV